MDRWCIYRTTNIVNGKTYIGQHKYKILAKDKYLGSGILIKEAIKKYGRDNFKREILVSNITSQDVANQLEIDYIAQERAKGKAEYNIADGGVSTHNRLIKYIPWNKGKKGLQTPWNKGKSGYHNRNKRSEVSKRKSSETMKQKFENEPERKKVMSERMKGNKIQKNYSRWLCVETQEVKSSKEWLDLGYRPHKLISKGLHFVNLRETTTH